MIPTGVSSPSDLASLRLWETQQAARERVQARVRAMALHQAKGRES